METPRLRLRRFQPDDAPRLDRYRSDASVARYQSWEAMTLEEAEAFIGALPELLGGALGTADEWSQIAIADNATNELIGDIGLCRKSSGIVEIGFTLDPAVQGRGYALEACGAVIASVLSLPDVMAMLAVIDSRNTSAIELVKRLGMVLDHTEEAEFKGEMCEEHHFVLRRGPPRAL